MDVFDAAERYHGEGRSLIVLAGKDYGSGSSRDWAAKGPWMLVRVGEREGGREVGDGDGVCFDIKPTCTYLPTWMYLYR